MSRFFCCILLVLLTGCTSAPLKEQDLPSIPLKQDEAALRSKQIAHASYVLWFGLDRDQETFRGRTVINFELTPRAKRIGKDVVVDLLNARIQSLSINGKNEENPDYDGNRIVLDIAQLNAGGNRVEISYTHKFGTAGRGLHRFVDPVDNEVYLYTDLQPFDAHNVFPCFDQPNLKASYELTVEAPGDWHIIANASESEVSEIDDERKSWQFPPTEVFSTYVFALHGGPYRKWQSKAGDTPMRLFARKSLAKHIDEKEWFAITKAGLEFFSIQFGYPYPYEKYDQIIVPDFNWGAMENVAAVTFNEKFIFRGKVTRQKRLNRALTILHEMAHMWFGNLVTMKWWNGLWLNESFATFSSYWALRRISKSPKIRGLGGIWEHFLIRKEKGYFEDQLVTSHPIETRVPDTQHAFTHFDGITYNKGAAVLKQLYFALGESDFREGLQRYFQVFARRNTTIGDFMQMLSEASGKDLNQWKKVWLQTKNTNSIEAQWSCETNPKTKRSVIRNIILKQSGLPLRPHRTKIALYDSNLKVRKVIPVEYSSSQKNIFKAIGEPCPTLVYPNHEDWDFVRVRLDSVSLKAVQKKLSKISSPLQRMMIWQDLWQMVLDGKLSPRRFIETASTHLPKEKNNAVLSTTLKKLLVRHVNQNSAVKFMNLTDRNRHLKKLENLARRQLLNARPWSDQQETWLIFYLQTAHSQSTANYLYDLIRYKKKIKGLTLNQERRWMIIQTLARVGFEKSNDLIQKELGRDETDRGKKEAIVAEVLLPDGEQKRLWMKRILNSEQTSSLPYPQIKKAMNSFQVLGQEDLNRDFIDAFFESLAPLSSREKTRFLSTYTKKMFPGFCSPDVIQETDKILNNSELNLNIAVKKALKVHRQNELRCIRAQQASALGA